MFTAMIYVLGLIGSLGLMIPAVCNIVKILKQIF